MQNFLDIIINGPARYTVGHHLSPAWALVVVIGALLIECTIVYVIALLLVKAVQQARNFTAFLLRSLGIGKREIDYSFLRMTFPTDTSKSAYATEQLHIIMQGLVKYRGFWERLAGRKQPYSLELVATRDDGIRYVAMIPKQEAETIRRTLLSFLPGLKVDKIKLLSSQTAIKYMEEDLMKIEAQIEELVNEKERKSAEQPISFDVVKKYAKYFLQHIDQLLLQQSDPIKKADFFGVIFDQTPTYDEIASVTNNGPNNFWNLTGINELFKIKRDQPIFDQSLLVRVQGL